MGSVWEVSWSGAPDRSAAQRPEGRRFVARAAAGAGTAVRGRSRPTIFTPGVRAAAGAFVWILAIEAQTCAGAGASMGSEWRWAGPPPMSAPPSRA